MKKNTGITELGTEKISALLLQYAVPAIIAMTAASLYNITDSIFIGHGVGKDAISGLVPTFPLMNLAAAFGAMVGVGASTLLSIRMGQKDYDSANKILGNVVMLNLITGVSFAIIFYFALDPVLLFFGASKQTLPYSRDFMRIILLGNVISHIYYGLNAVLRASGQPEKSMYATLMTVGINLILNPLFIFGFKWGIRGSALATIISQCVMLVWQYSLFNKKDSLLKFSLEGLRLKKRIVIDSVSIGLSPFLMNAASCIIVILITRGMRDTGGDDAVGAYGIVNRIAFLFVMIVIGLNQGMQPIAGYNYGAKKYDRVIIIFKKTVFYATITMCVGFLMAYLVPHNIATLFTPDANQINLITEGMRIVFTFYPLVGFQMVTANFFQSMGMVKKSIFLSITRQVLFLIPLLIFLPKIWGTNGVWWSMPISDAVASVVAAGLLISQLRKFKALENI
ncbi:MAG: MATE family efflux transporter [Paludibacter sp.]|nr:MATE family efflux transporter [Paludibacter sp.]